MTLLTSPEQHTLPTHVSASLVTEMGREFSLDDIMEVEEKALQGLKGKGSNHMLVESLGPAMAIMDESQLESDDEMGDDDDKENSDDSMDDDDEEEEEEGELKGVKVAVSKSRKSSVTSTLSKRSTRLKKLEEVKSHILQQNQKRKEDYKKMKKQRKRADKLASSLSDSLIGSLTMGSNEDKDGDYDFSVLG